jgi:hypothetical protein
MSTRCQVFVTNNDINHSPGVTLYHRCDGYPENMLPTIAKGFQECFQAHRAGKAASMICGADPKGFEIEQGHALHGDIEFYYVVDVTSDWTITVYSTSFCSPPFDVESIKQMGFLGTYSVEQALEWT